MKKVAATSGHKVSGRDFLGLSAVSRDERRVNWTAASWGTNLVSEEYRKSE